MELEPRRESRVAWPARVGPASPVWVLKFGSSVLADDDGLAPAVHEVYRAVRRGRRVVAVVSAQKGTTEELIQRCLRLTPDPPPAAFAALLGCGEAASVAAFAMAADRAGIPTRFLDARALGIETAGDPLDAEPCRLASDALRRALSEAALVVVPGFVGVDADGSPTLLGRGGSDLTALFIARELGAERCRLLKDVDGWLVEPPGSNGVPPRRFRQLSFADALAAPARVVQERAAAFAARDGLAFQVCRWGSDGGTWIGPLPSYTAEMVSRPPLEVVVLGAGTVGAGVCRHLAAHGDRFRVRAVLVRDRERERESWMRREWLTEDPEEALSQRDAVVVELMGGLEPAAGLVSRALERGQTVVTANKALLAELGPALAAAADRGGGRLLGSAAVGGATPMLELVARRAPTGIVRLRGVLNATCNWILDRLAAGEPLAEALAAARQRGIAEADPGADLCGLDAAHKLVLLLRAASGRPAALEEVTFSGLEVDRVMGGQPVRLVADAWLDGDGGLRAARVRQERLAADDPLAEVGGEWNALTVTTADGVSESVVGRGAGRWPTAEAVLADLVDLAAEAGR